MWFPSNSGLGTSTYPVNGFIYSGAGPKLQPNDLDAALITIASVDLAKFDSPSAN